jgi:PAS domain S-box-containing protein
MSNAMDALDYEQLFQSIPSPYMVLDRQLRYVAANTAYLKATSSTWDQLKGNGLFDIFPNDGESGRRLRASLERVFQTGKRDTLAYIRYEIPSADGTGMEDRFWTAVHIPLFDDKGNVAYVVQNTVDVTELQQLRQASFLPFRSHGPGIDLIERAREAEEAQITLKNENSDFRRLFEQAPGMIAVLSGPDHVFTFVNESYTSFIGGRDVLGMDVRSALPDIAGQGFYEKLDQVYQTGEPVKENGARVVFQREPDAPKVELFLDFSYHPIFDTQDNVTGIFVQGLERTESVKAEQARELLLRELNHRVKNLFTVAMSMVNMTARNATTPKEMATILTGRLGALSHAHSMVMNESHPTNGDAHISFEDMLRKIVAPHLVDQQVEIRLDGPELTLGSKAATSLALVMHELATNAAKYGAMSQPGGEVSVEWALEDEMIAMRWSEKGGPPITGTPQPSGFGSRLSRISVEGQLDGSLAFQWPSDGVVVDIRFPKQNAQQ